MDDDYYPDGRLSDCCGARVIIHDICSECLEHCNIEDEENTIQENCK